MQIALTKKLADVMGIKPGEANKDADPLFSWTASWVRVWENRKAEDMLVMVNNATRFTVAIYEVKRKDLKKNVPEMMTAAIKNTLLALNLNPEIVDEYMRQCGEVEFAVNRDRQLTAWVNRAGVECALHVGHNYNGIDKMFSDTVGAEANNRIVGYSNNQKDYFKPKEKFFDAITKLTDLPVYSYRAYELLVTLDLEIYKATRRLIVPADIGLPELHDVLQSAFGWKDCHLHDWCAFAEKDRRLAARLVMTDLDLEYDENAILEAGHVLSDYLPKYSHLLYTYDMGDSWEHQIELVCVTDDCQEESPYLLEAVGQTPPEDVGGVGGFLDFREKMLDPNHESHTETKAWAGYWQSELSEWECRPRVIHG
jgi:hypothetical protein